METRFNRLVQNWQRATSGLVLCAVEDLMPVQVGRGKLTQYLRGSQSTFIVDNDLHELESYAALSFLSGPQINLVLDDLERTGLLRVVASSVLGLPVLELTDSGHLFLADAFTALPDLGSFWRLVVRDVPELDEEESALLYELTASRDSIAREAGRVRRYEVCSAACLRRIAKARPRTAEELLAVNGVGDHFIRNYGERFLRDIDRFVAK